MKVSAPLRAMTARTQAPPPRYSDRLFCKFHLYQLPSASHPPACGVKHHTTIESVQASSILRQAPLERPQSSTTTVGPQMRGSKSFNNLMIAFHPPFPPDKNGLRVIARDAIARAAEAAMRQLSFGKAKPRASGTATPTACAMLAHVAWFAVCQHRHAAPPSRPKSKSPESPAHPTTSTRPARLIIART